MLYVMAAQVLITRKNALPFPVWRVAEPARAVSNGNCPIQSRLKDQ
jgi:hypothetical protein